MKKTILAIIAVAISSFTAQSQLDTIMQETISYGLDDYIEKCTDIPIVRKINGGTVFDVSYEGDWTLEMKGAFEYACKIWEENIPNCPPIKIKVTIGTIRGTQGQKALSKVTFRTHSDLGYYHDGGAATRAQIKAILLTEYISGGNTQFIDGISGMSFFNEEDFTITYNSTMLDEFSFSLYSTPTDKYDFVTLVLKDIARGLGISSKITGSSTTGTLDITGQEPISFEKKIWEALGTSDPKVAYTNATKGQLPIWNGKMILYAPETWTNGISLNAFIPDSTMRLTELLSYQFGRGTVIRNITHDDYPTFFIGVLGWWGDRLTGGDTGSVSATGSTGNVIPYKGTISIETNVTPTNVEALQTNSLMRSTNSDFVVDEYCEVYHPAYRPNINDHSDGWNVSILKKDGTWDLLYYNSAYFQPLNVNMNDMTFNFNDSVYSRTCDGHLRCRVTQSYTQSNSWGTNNVNNVTYFAMDYLPQQPTIEFGGVVSTETGATRTITDDYDYYRDVKINIKNLEGIDRILVEQLDEGNILPYKYEIIDFKKGYFIATVDKEFYTHLTVVAYNENGSSRSETLEIEPLEPASSNYIVQLYGNEISISGNNNIRENNYLQSYEIQSLTNLNGTAEISDTITTDNARIDISSLKSGLYVLNYYDNRNNKYSFKFKK